jgi:predicted O-methyltransferase YrrM
MKNAAKRLIDATLVPLVGYIARKISTEPRLILPALGVVHESRGRAVADAADYADSRMAQALCLPGIEKLWRHAFAARTPGGLIAEFGVFTGTSISFFASLTAETIYGFDSFEGLREDWKGWENAKGTFDLKGVPPLVPANVTLVKGWFDQTLPPFLRQHAEPFSFIHIDCDTYEATAAILQLAGDRFRKGTVVVFDEYFGYRGWRLGEFKAWQEFVAARELQYEYLAFSNFAASLVII